MRSYDYSRRQGIQEISWEYFAKLAKSLAEKLSHERIDAIVGIARAGLFPATAIACALRLELYPIRVTRREDDQVIRAHPIWKVDVSPEVAARSVAVVDEIADSGETLVMVADRARELGAARVVTAALVTHSWARPLPAYSALVSDALVIFPWDSQVLIGGEWRVHPEYQAAMLLQVRDQEGTSTQ